MLIDRVALVGKFMKITEAEMHEKNFLKDILVPRYSMMILHKAFDLYRQFAEWTADDVYFIIRQKSNAYDVVVSTLSWQRSQMNTARMNKERRMYHLVLSLLI
jgi:hypothetical protein